MLVNVYVNIQIFTDKNPALSLNMYCSISSFICILDQLNLENFNLLC